MNSVDPCLGLLNNLQREANEQCVRRVVHLPMFERRTVAEIQNGVIKQGERNTISRVFHAKNDRDAVATWRQDLNRILHVFNVRSINPVWR